jgi:hypothetical protein
MLYFRIATYPYLTSALVGSLAIYLWSHPRARSLIGTPLVELAFAAMEVVAEGDGFFPAAAFPVC